MADKKISMLYGLLTSIASKITYDNTTSGLTADNVQDAIDEISSDLVIEDISEEFRTSMYPMDSTDGSTLVSVEAYKIGKIVSVTIVASNSLSAKNAGEDVAKFYFTKYKPVINTRNDGFSSGIITGLYLSINTTPPSLGTRPLTGQVSINQSISTNITYITEE